LSILDREPDAGSLLRIYLNDHLTGATAVLQRLPNVLASNRGTSFEPTLRRMLREIEEDRRVLRQVMDRLDMPESLPKMLLARVGERLGRLKTNGRAMGYSDLSRLIEFEALLVGSMGRLGLWRVLKDVAKEDPRLSEFDFSALEHQTSKQLDEIEAQRRDAARAAFLT
jgi:hypothetical protein